MLDITRKATYTDGDGTAWDYYGDDADASVVYVLPAPQFVMVDGKPSIQVTRYASDGPDNGSGFVRLDVELSVPAAVIAAVAEAAPTALADLKAPVKFTTPDYDQGGRAFLTLESEATRTTYPASVSAFGSNMATFEMALSATQLATLTGALSSEGGAVPVSYRVTVPARLPAVTATLSFDSSIAFAYQVTQPRYDSWGEETSPGSVSEMLNESASSKVTIKWGTADPDPALRQAVAEWANDTLADLVSAEVAKVIAVRGLSSDHSFDINEVSSFTSTYDEDMVVDWVLSPAAALPSLASLGQELSDYTNVVDERQQHMTVSAFLPFGGEPAVDSETVVDGEPAVDRVTVTVDYPGLDQANATQVFTANSSHTFAAPYDATAGPDWSLTYEVNFADSSTPPVKASVGPLSTGAYSLDVPQIGVLRVGFDAQQAFATGTARPNRIDVTLTMSPDDNGELVRELASVAATDEPQRTHIRIHRPVPLESPYNYQITYYYDGGVAYTAPLIQDQSGPRQVIPAAAAAATTNLIVFVPAPKVAGEEIFEADVRIWYAHDDSAPSPTAIPGVSSLPTADSPATFTVTPGPDPTGNLFGRATFTGIASGYAPLVYSATIDGATGQVVIAESLVENDIPSIMVTPTQRYFTVEVDPAAVDWAASGYESIEVLIDAKVAQGAAPGPPAGQPTQRSFTWNSGESGSRFVTYAVAEGNSLTYDWKVNYLTTGMPVTTASGTAATDTILNVPAR